MAGRTSIFYRDWRNRKRWRCRLMIIPAQLIGTIMLHETDRPAWRTNPDPGSQYVRIPRFVMYGMTELESRFEKRPLGLFDAAGMKIGVNITRLEAAGGDLAELPGFLLDPAPASCRGRLYTNGAHTRFSVFPTPNVFVLLTDRGDGSLNVEDFATEFVGVQRKNAADEIVCRRKAQRARIECDIVDIIKYTLENVQAEHITRLFLDLYGDDSGSYKPNNVTGSTMTYYNDLWRANDINFAHCIQTFFQPDGPSGPKSHDTARYYRLVRYWQVVARLVDNAFHEVMKQNFTVGNRRFRFRYSGDLSIVDPTPQEHLTYFKKAHDAANTVGAAIARTDVCFNGVIWWSPDGYYDDVKPIYGTGARDDKFVGGFLIDHSGEGSHYAKEIANVWDHLKRATRLLMRCEVRRVEPARVDFWFCRLYDAANWVEESTLPTLRRRDIRKKATEDVTVVLRADMISGCDVAIPNGEGRDLGNVEVRDGTIDDDDETFTLVLHNLPKVGNESNRYQMAWDQVDLVAPFVVGASSTFNPLQLAYADTPAGISTNEIMIRPHDWVGIDLGNGTYIMEEIHQDGVPLALPVVTSDYLVDEDDGGLASMVFDRLWWLLVRDRAERAQKESCLAWAIARRGLDVFGSSKRWSIEEPFHPSKARLDRVGSKFVLAERDDTPGTLGVFLDGSTVLDDLPAYAICTRAKLNVNTGETDAAFTGFEDV